MKKYILFYYTEKYDTYVSQMVYSIDELRDIIHDDNKIILFQEIDDIDDYYDKIDEEFMVRLLKIYDIDFYEIADKIVTSH